MTFPRNDRDGSIKLRRLLSPLSPSPSIVAARKRTMDEFLRGRRKKATSLRPVVGLDGPIPFRFSPEVMKRPRDFSEGESRGSGPGFSWPLTPLLFYRAWRLDCGWVCFRGTPHTHQSRLIPPPGMGGRRREEGRLFTLPSLLAHRIILPSPKKRGMRNAAAGRRQRERSLEQREN